MLFICGVAAAVMLIGWSLHPSGGGLGDPAWGRLDNFPLPRNVNWIYLLPPDRGSGPHPMGRSCEHIVSGALGVRSEEHHQLAAPFTGRLPHGFCHSPGGLWSSDVAAGADRFEQYAAEP